MQEFFSALLLFFVTALISSYGSIQLGPVNGGVLKYCFRGEFRSAIWLAFGGSLAEIPYASLALWGSAWLKKMEGLESYVSVIIAPIFLLLGIRFLISAAKSQNFDQLASGRSAKSPFREGIVLALFNPQLPLFWISILLWMKTSLGLYPDGIFRQVSFVLGTAAGAFYLLFLMIRISIKNRHKLGELSRRYKPEKLLGWFFICMAALQAIRLFWS